MAGSRFKWHHLIEQVMADSMGGMPAQVKRRVCDEMLGVLSGDLNVVERLFNHVLSVKSSEGAVGVIEGQWKVAQLERWLTDDTDVPEDIVSNMDHHYGKQNQFQFIGAGQRPDGVDDHVSNPTIAHEKDQFAFLSSRLVGAVVAKWEFDAARFLHNVSSLVKKAFEVLQDKAALLFAEAPKMFPLTLAKPWPSLDAPPSSSPRHPRCSP